MLTRRSLTTLLDAYFRLFIVLPKDLYAPARVIDFFSFVSLLSCVKLIIYRKFFFEIINSFIYIETLMLDTRCSLRNEELVYTIVCIRFTWFNYTATHLVNIYLEIRRKSMQKHRKISHRPSRVHQWKRQNV